MDIIVAEAEVAGVASGAEAAGSGDSVPEVTMFAALLVAQAGLRSALSVPDGACVHVCYASFALHKDVYPQDRALPLVDSHAGLVVATAGGSWYSVPKTRLRASG